MKAVDSFFSIFFYFIYSTFFFPFIFISSTTSLRRLSATTKRLEFTALFYKEYRLCRTFFFGLSVSSSLFYPLFIFLLPFLTLFNIFMLPFQIPRNIRTHVHPPCAEASCCTACTGSPNRWYATLYQSVQVRSPSLSTAKSIFIFLISHTQRQEHTYTPIFLRVCVRSNTYTRVHITLYVFYFELYGAKVAKDIDILL